MAETTGITWARSTFNAWIGCTKVSPACDACYAEQLDKRHKWKGATHWGAGVQRMRTSVGNWNKVKRWNEAAKHEMDTRTGGFHGRPGFWPVFTNSLADFADNEVPAQWHADLARLVEDTPYLSWLLVTKRISNVARLYPNWASNGFPRNARIIISVGNQEEADRDVPKLLALPCLNGVSYEPALGPVDWTQIKIKDSDAPERGKPDVTFNALAGWYGGSGNPARLQWIIVGGESSQGAHMARPFDVAWGRSTIAQCKAVGVPVFVKQLGSCPEWPGLKPGHLVGCATKDRAGANPTEWPEDLCVQEMPA